ncbi:MAG: DUF4405 domain-containing protein [Flammeovirgaceae bacterium]
MNTFRKAVSISLLFSFLVLTITGILSFFMAYSYVIESLHVFSGFLFSIVALLHVLNNIKSITRYIIEKS